MHLHNRADKTSDICATSIDCVHYCSGGGIVVVVIVIGSGGNSSRANLISVLASLRLCALTNGAKIGKHTFVRARPRTEKFFTKQTNTSKPL